MLPVVTTDFNVSQTTVELWLYETVLMELMESYFYGSHAHSGTQQHVGSLFKKKAE